VDMARAPNRGSGSGGQLGAQTPSRIPRRPSDDLGRHHQ
jgi:hypothetical protein